MIDLTQHIQSRADDLARPVVRRGRHHRAWAVAALAMAGAGLAVAADDTFVQKAAAGGMTEVAAGQMASQKASSATVKDFGQKMVDDHGKANDELKQIATSKSMTVPPGPDQKHQAALTKLQGQSAAGFDKAFKAQMVADHKETIALFEQESKSGKDADLKAFATKTLPTLREHLKMAQALP